MADRTSLPWHTPYAPAASADDVLACFRLVLGRHPNPEEWTGHLAASVGQPLDAVVANYLNSAEFAARGLLQPRAQAGLRLVELAEYRIYAPEADEAVGRHVVHGRYEPDVEAVLRRFVRPGMGMVDVGANIGVFALLFAALAGPDGFVLAVEPNPANARLIEASRLANGFGHLVVCQAAATAEMGVLALHSFDTNGSVSRGTEAGLLSAHTVAALPLDTLVGPIRRIDLVKIDVEGAEFLALGGAAQLLARCRPVIVSEFSPGQLRTVSGVDGPTYLRLLAGLGYRLGVIGAGGGFELGASEAEVMAAYEAAGVDHIDIVAVPDGRAL